GYFLLERLLDLLDAEHAAIDLEVVDAAVPVVVGLRPGAADLVARGPARRRGAVGERGLDAVDEEVVRLAVPHTDDLIPVLGLNHGVACDVAAGGVVAGPAPVAEAEAAVGVDAEEPVADLFAACGARDAASVGGVAAGQVVGVRPDRNRERTGAH